MKHVLIVDDDIDLLELVCLMVKANHFSVKCAPNGSAVFSLLAAEHFDLILMDIYLGDADGRELARQLKSDTAYQHIPILLYSAGHITAESIQHSMADGFLEKPFEMPILIDRLRGMVVA